jgi:hypothetical protein
MAHFAQLDADNNVLQVIVVDNNDILDEDGNESEALGITFCQNLFGSDTTWVQTSYNLNFRTHFASVNGTYDSTLDAFIPPKPFPSWLLDNDTLTWYPPVTRPLPTDDISHYYDESLETWVGVAWDWDEDNTKWVGIRYKQDLTDSDLWTEVPEGEGDPSTNPEVTG